MASKKKYSAWSTDSSRKNSPKSLENQSMRSPCLTTTRRSKIQSTYRQWWKNWNQAGTRGPSRWEKTSTRWWSTAGCSMHISTSCELPKSLKTASRQNGQTFRNFWNKKTSISTTPSISLRKCLKIWRRLKIKITIASPATCRQFWASYRSATKNQCLSIESCRPFRPNWYKLTRERMSCQSSWTTNRWNTLPWDHSKNKVYWIFRLTARRWARCSKRCLLKNWQNTRKYFTTKWCGSKTKSSRNVCKEKDSERCRHLNISHLTSKMET